MNISDVNTLSRVYQNNAEICRRKIENPWCNDDDTQLISTVYNQSEQMVLVEVIKASVPTFRIKLIKQFPNNFTPRYVWKITAESCRYQFRPIIGVVIQQYLSEIPTVLQGPVLKISQYSGTVRNLFSVNLQAAGWFAIYRSSSFCKYLFKLEQEQRTV